MRIFLWNILLASAWAFAGGEFGVANFAVGFALGYFVLALASSLLGESGYNRKMGQIVRFTIFYLWQIALSNLRVAYDVLTPTYHMRPGIIAIPLDAQTDEEIMLLANLITLTPGTLALDVSDDRSTLYIHAMFIDDVDQVRRELKEGLERRVLEVLR